MKVTKAIKALRSFQHKNELKNMCKDMGVSYSLCLAIANGKKAPTYEIIKKLIPLFGVKSWFEEEEINEK